MRFWIQTIAFTAAFTTLGFVAYQQAREHAEHAQPPLGVPAGHPGIPDDFKRGIEDSFHH